MSEDAKPTRRPEEQAVRARIERAELDRQRAAAGLDALTSGTKLMGGLGWGLMSPNAEELRTQEADAIERRTAAIAELAAIEKAASS
jgi:hypothetical protein